jgi:AraC family transcriptional regulator
MPSSTEPVLLIDTTDLAQVHKVLPFSPSSMDLQPGQQDFFMLHYDRVPPYAIPSYSSQGHLFGLWGSQSQAYRDAKIDDVAVHSLYGHGQNCIIPAGATHQTAWDQPIEMSALFIHPQFIHHVAQDIANTDRIELIPTHDTQNMTLHHLGMAYKTQMQRSQGLEKDSVYQESIMTAFVMQLLQHHVVKPATPKTYEKGLSTSALHQITGYIEAHLTQDLKLTELANLVHFSPYYLCRLFKKSTGQTLHQYVLEKRLEQAHTLLRQSNLSVVEISSRCGFSNHSHLNRHFKNKYGIPPSHLRQA